MSAQIGHATSGSPATACKPSPVSDVRSVYTAVYAMYDATNECAATRAGTHDAVTGTSTSSSSSSPLAVSAAMVAACPTVP